MIRNDTNIYSYINKQIKWCVNNFIKVKRLAGYFFLLSLILTISLSASLQKKKYKDFKNICLSEYIS